MSNKEEMVEVYRTGSIVEAEFIRIFLGSKGIHCVLKPDYGDRIMVKESIARKAWRLIAQIRPISWSWVQEEAPEERTKEILKNLHDAVVDYDEDKAVKWCNIAKREGADPYLCVMKGLAAGMHTVGEMYENKEYFVPEVLLCCDALYAGLDILRPLIPKGVSRVIGAVVIGVLEGDVHDMGKNLVKMMFDIAGWTVYDLGRDVDITKFATEQLRTDAEMVAMSAMTTTSMTGMPKVIKIVKERNPDVQIIIGGSPITEDTVGIFGADGYASNAANAVDKAVKMIDHLWKLRVERVIV
jgi:methanogenic corrinoid protein MtbC1